MSPWWKDLITKLLLLYAAFKIAANVVVIFRGYFRKDNPLIPDYLAHYIAFPQYFLITIWIIFFVVCLRLVRNTDRLKKWFYPVLFAMVVYQLMEIYVYQFLMHINPYG